MSTPSVSSVSHSDYTSSDSSSSLEKVQQKNLLGYDSFLKLMLEQLKHQDPTSPADTTQQLAQLASFSQVEQSVQANSKLDQILATLNLSQSTAILGKQLTSADGSVTGTAVSIQATKTGSTALLDNGQTLPLGAGVIISASPQT